MACMTSRIRISIDLREGSNATGNRSSHDNSRTNFRKPTFPCALLPTTPTLCARARSVITLECPWSDFHDLPSEHVRGKSQCYLFLICIAHILHTIVLILRDLRLAVLHFHNIYISMLMCFVVEGLLDLDLVCARMPLSMVHSDELSHF